MEGKNLIDGEPKCTEARQKGNLGNEGLQYREQGEERLDGARDAAEMCALLRIPPSS